MSMGFLMVIVGIIQNIGVINRIKKYMDKVIDSDVSFNTQQNNSTPLQQSSTSVGGGLRIIRGQMPQAQVVEKEQTKKPARSQTPTKVAPKVKKKTVQPTKTS